MKEIKNAIAVASGKGGVGKSSTAVMMALSMKEMGLKVGLLDADIYGPSIPKMFGIKEKPKSDGQKLEPIKKYNNKIVFDGGLLIDKYLPPSKMSSSVSSQGLAFELDK